MIPHRFCRTVLAAFLMAPALSHAATDYLDATASNSTLADGTALNLADPPVNPEDYSTSGSWAAANDHWHLRTGFANGSDVWASNAGSDSPALRTTITGLTPGADYEVFVYYWVAGDGSPTGNNQWDIMAGLAAGALNEILWNDGTQVTDDSGFTSPPLISEGNRRLFEYGLGVVAADGSGEIAIYIDDLPGNDDRTWYDGVGSRLSLSKRWDGGGTDTLWTTAENWVGDAAPVAGDPLIFTGDIGLSNENDFPADTSFTGIVFDADADEFILGGNGITLSGDIENRSPLDQTVDLPLLLDADRNARVTDGATLLFLNGVVGGAFGLTKEGQGELELSAANTYTGVLTVDQGTVVLLNDQSGAAGGIVVGPASQVAASLLVDVSATVAVATGNLFRIGSYSASGFTGPVVDAEGAVTNDGELFVGRIGTLNIWDGGAWTQSGEASLNGVGGYSSNMNLNDGARFDHTGSNPFQLNGADGNSGQARLNVSGTGVFTTGAGFEQVTVPTSGFGRITLSEGGTLKLSADVAQLTTTVQFALGSGGGAVDTNGFSATLDADLFGDGGLTKRGAGTLTSTGLVSYLGGTVVEAGTLSLADDNLADDASVEIAAGATLDLDHAGQDVVGALLIDGVPQAVGTWGATGSAADHQTPRITGTGWLEVVPSDPFLAWIDGFDPPLTDPADKTKTTDPDGDKLDNLTEFALNDDPSSGVASGKIAGKTAGVGGEEVLTLSIPVLDAATADPGDPVGGELVLGGDGVTYRIQASDDLVDWTTLEVSEVTGADATAIQAGLPALDSGWSYRTFRSPGPVAADPIEFLRTVVEEAP